MFARPACPADGLRHSPNGRSSRGGASLALTAGGGAVATWGAQAHRQFQQPPAAEAARFLGQAAFGGTAADVASVRAWV
jgi:hypothetical protein